MEKTEYYFKVCHPIHGEEDVTAPDRYQALLAAAKAWGLRWTTIAKDCIVIQLGKTPISKRRKEGTSSGKADKKKS